MAAPHSPRTEGPKTGFVINPFHKNTPGMSKKLSGDYRKLKGVFADANKGAQKLGGMPIVLAKAGLAEHKGYGTLIDIESLPLMAHAMPEMAPFIGFMVRAHSVGNPAENRMAQREALAVVKQLRELGHSVHVQDFGRRGQEAFTRMAVRHGAERVQMPRGMGFEHDLISSIQPGHTWARDQYVTIGGRKERPVSNPLLMMMTGDSGMFGEGGQVVQVGPREFAINENLKEDPRVEEYERKGYTFHPMPRGGSYDRPMSDLFETPIYTKQSHLDFNLGGIPERRIVAVDPHYYSDHKLSVQMLRDNLGLKLVEVPKEEARRHPANFLPLGGGRVLVDSGAPKFIEKLRAAGAEVVPTKVPLDYLMSQKGGLHCLFNEA